MNGERKVAGLWCREVLAKLYDYLDDELEPDERSRFEEHLAGCSVCTTFGGRAAALAKAIQARLAEPEPISDALSQRLLKVGEDPDA